MDDLEKFHIDTLAAMNKTHRLEYVREFETDLEDQKQATLDRIVTLITGIPLVRIG